MWWCKYDNVYQENVRKKRTKKALPVFSFFYIYADFYLFLDSEIEIVVKFFDEIFLKPPFHQIFNFYTTCDLLTMEHYWKINSSSWQKIEFEV